MYSPVFNVNSENWSNNPSFKFAWLTTLFAVAVVPDTPFPNTSVVSVHNWNWEILAFPTVPDLLLFTTNFQYLYVVDAESISITSTPDVFCDNFDTSFQVRTPDPSVFKWYPSPPTFGGNVNDKLPLLDGTFNAVLSFPSPTITSLAWNLA